MMKKNFLTLIFIFIIFSFNVNTSFSQIKLDISSSPNPVGSGARALGMGGAFISMANDATGASWNPACLEQLDYPEISFVGNWFHRIEDNDFTRTEANGKQNVYKNDLNYISFAYPTEKIFDLKMVFSANYQKLYDFTREWNFSLENIQPNPDYPLFYNGNINYQVDGDISALGLAYCVEVIPTQLFIGATFNFWNDGLMGLNDNKWEESQHLSGLMFSSIQDQSSPLQFFDYNLKKYYSLDKGRNTNIGALWNWCGQDKLRVGLVLKLPFTADITREDRDVTITRNAQTNEVEVNDVLPDAQRIHKQELKMPMSYGIGISYEFSDKFKAGIDLYRTEWGDYLIKDENGYETSPITDKSKDDSNIDATHQIRIGGEYRHVKSKDTIYAVRGGLFYDPAPSRGSPDDYYGISLGFGITKGMPQKISQSIRVRQISFDIAGQYRFGNDVNTSLLENDQYVSEFSQDVHEYMAYSSIILYFE